MRGDTQRQRRNQRWAERTTATYNLVRMAKLEAIAT